MIKQKIKPVIFFFLLINGFFSCQTKQSESYFYDKEGKIISYGIPTYNNINQKSWDQILMEDEFHWRPPYTVHLPVQPVHSSDWIHVDAALNVCRRHVTQNVHTRDTKAREAARTQETWIVQFAFEDPPVIPDFHLSTLSLAENKYPLPRGDYFARALHYQVEYMSCQVNEEQSLLWLNVSVTNESEFEQDAHVRVKINFQNENDLFDYHYVPFYWDASKWLKCNRVKLENSLIIKEGQTIGKIIPGSMDVSWEEDINFTDREYNLNLRTTRMSGYVQPHMRLKNAQDVIHARGKLKPEESKTFSLALLVNYNNISEEDLSFLAKSSGKEIREQSLSHFKSQFTEEKTKMSFKAGNWEDIFTALQLSTLQLLIKYPDKDYYMPSQGGSSERFFVWVWEAVHMLRPMLRTGHFEPVRKGLDFIFSLQDGGVPPEGNFTTTKGSVGTTGPRWANSTGSALALACDYYLYSNDESFLDIYLPKILAAGAWIIGEIKATRKLNADGTRPLFYGIMPWAVATDGDHGYVVASTDAYNFWGLEKTVQLLERIDHVNAKEFRSELESYREDLAVTIEGLSRQDGFIDRKIITKEKESRISREFENVCSSANLGYTGAIDLNSDVFQRFINYYENNRANGYFMGKMDREITYIGTAEYVWQHIYLSLGEWKKAFAVTQANLKYGMTQDAYQVQERFSKRDPSFTCWQPNGSGNGRMMDMILNSICFETHNGITLLGGIPFTWLKTNKITSLQNLYTSFGELNLEIIFNEKRNCLLTLSSSDPAVLTREIRFPGHLNVKAKSSIVKDYGNGIFKAKGKADHLVFTITEAGI